MRDHRIVLYLCGFNLTATAFNGIILTAKYCGGRDWFIPAPKVHRPENSQAKGLSQ
jgi:hypothetical protein